MSFILDALRKSENERRREIAPSLAHAPLATIKRETPMGVWLVIAVLSLALVALGAAWWLNSPGETPPVAVTLPEPAMPAVRTGGGNVQLEPLRAAEAEANAPPQIRSISELADIDPALGDLRLELLAYNSADPSRGSAWINGRRYFPGERIGTGPELIEVRVDSVVLAHRGERFLLTVR